MSSHWCYRCNRFVRLMRQDILMCPECDSGFVEEIDSPARALHVDGPLRRFPAAAMYMIGHHHLRHGFDNDNSPRHARRRQLCVNLGSGGDRSPFNPVIMLRGGSGGGSAEGTSREGGETRHGFELFYDDGGGSGLRPVPPSMSEFLLGSGFDRVLEQLSQIETNGGGVRHDQNHPLPASKSAVEALPTVEIDATHLATESHCAVCKEPFELGITAREMPCKHIYHSDCILPWLAMKNSCPVCRHELPVDEDHAHNARGVGQSLNEEENVGLTIWRLPGGGFAVGRFSGGRRGNERDVPGVYTEMDGGLNNIGGEPRRISWSVSSSPRGVYRERESGGGLRRMVNNLFGCFRGGVQHQRSDSTRELTLPLRSSNGSRRSAEPSSRSRRTWSMDVNSGTRPW